ncbi:MAG TPA: hypothetical protein PKX16_03910 [Kiritimatiellia bacterium]|nr:hypothetical protein [Kiritimatiellia bacterium]HQQ61594.1 hypothetical protein [Kiritimatiellia bacterium]
MRHEIGIPVGINRNRLGFEGAIIGGSPAPRHQEKRCRAYPSFRMPASLHCHHKAIHFNEIRNRHSDCRTDLMVNLIQIGNGGQGPEPHFEFSRDERALSGV